ncbi:hypothetical protein Pint_02721 [Pistacia integerrima]|uniref:Uncharacterized protein n=1 Tax=Pistacia integerrima TaxID=434235 RepID=A0ACC0ZG02_9ROSI|nr:hypothetical protein Pint_02721 [Pistacia integerrima]
MQGDTNNSASVCSSTVSFCPSFNSYASSKLVDIAVKVAERQENDVVNSGIAEDFEFVSDGRVGSDARELFVDGQIRQVFPVFNRALLLNEEDGYDNYTTPRKLRVSLKNLFVEEGGGGGGGGEGPPPPSSPSSSEEDELEAVPEDTYCVWSPKRNNKVAASPNRSNSTGSTSSFKGWFKFPRLLRRSNSEGGHKDSFLFLHKKKTNADSEAPKQQGSKEGMVKRGGYSKVKLSPLHEVKLSPSHEVFFMKNKAVKEVDHKKRSSYLPYKQDLLGFFVNNVSSLGKTFAPF